MISIDKAWTIFSVFAIIGIVVVAGLLVYASVATHVPSIESCTTSFVGG